MRTLSILLFALTVLQCNEDEELPLIQEEKNLIENLDEGNPIEDEGNIIENENPLNWPWRGININSRDTVGVNENRIKEIKTSGVNALRIVIAARDFSIKYNLDIEDGVELNLQWCEKVIKWCAQNGIVVIIESIDFPLDPLKKFERWSTKFWESEVELNIALEYISKLVLKFDKYENVAAYGFFSEPVVTLDGISGVRPNNWFDFFEKILIKIRAHSNKYILFTPGPAGFPKGYLDFEEIFQDNKVIYGFHYYLPFSFSHQGIGNRSDVFKYPGLIENKYWDINGIREAISPAVNWASEHDKLLYVGEFSAVRWAEGKDQYLEDILSVFEENGISYNYWVLNDWVGWDMDFEPIEKGSKELIKPPNKTRTRQILENFWSRNN